MDYDEGGDNLVGANADWQKLLSWKLLYQKKTIKILCQQYPSQKCLQASIYWNYLKFVTMSVFTLINHLVFLDFGLYIVLVSQLVNNPDNNNKKQISSRNMNASLSQNFTLIPTT